MTFIAQDHTEFPGAFSRIARDRDTKGVISSGAGAYMAQVDFSTFCNVGDPDVWSRVHDDGVPILENIANIRVPMIAAIEGRARIHSDYALLANGIVAGDSASFGDLPHVVAGIVPGDGIHTTRSCRAGPGRSEGWLQIPTPIADIAHFCRLRRREFAGVSFDSRPGLAGWHAAAEARPAVQRGVAAVLALA